MSCCDFDAEYMDREERDECGLDKLRMFHGESEF